ncbi:MAG: phosphohydrolase [Candidatus Nitrosocaldaceae archaeon]|nr:MAG: phosphohydrolase [Candidatus Nitrosocaldaceae archaeon]
MNILKEYVYSLIDDKQDPAHMIDHIERVYEIGMLIGREEGADLRILSPALLFHDIIRPTDEEQELDHAIRSAEFAQVILAEFGYNREEIDKIVDAIIKSSTSNAYQSIPNTLESKILFDADKLDGIGEIGVKRVEMLWRRRFAIKNQEYDPKIVARWYLKKIIQVSKIGLFTNKARELARERILISLNYCKDILKDEYYDIINGAPAGI